MSVLSNGVYEGSINSQECKSFEIYAGTIKISMTEYHHLINPSGSWFILILQFMKENECGISGHRAYFHFLEAIITNAFELQFCQGFIFTPNHRH